MCDYPDDPSVTNSGVSQADIQRILDKHNEFRSRVYPRAKDMQKTFWDPKLAELAQKWANTCEMYHDKGVQRQIPEYLIPIGQNWAGGYNSWDEVIIKWAEEEKNFRFGSYNNLNDVGHYTQIINANASAVGCGYAECPNRSLRTNFVCDYAFGQWDIDHPYESGANCANCPGKCVNNLCDCGGLFCKHGGIIDVRTCRCKCPSYASGRSCEILNCPAADQAYCGPSQPYGYPKNFCDVYHVLWPLCPVMCGICDETCPGKKADYCQNGGTLRSYDCQCDCPRGYWGNQCQKIDACPPDESFCGRPYPKGYTKDYCGDYHGIEELCPRMCGLC